MLPSALNKASLLANILTTLSSQKAIKSPWALALENNFCILPYTGFNSFVIFSACINWFKLFTLLVELYKPENIKPFFLLSFLYISSGSVVVEATLNWEL